MLPKSGIWFRHSSELFRALPAKKQSLGAGRLGQQIAIAENVSYRNGIMDPHAEAVAGRPGRRTGQTSNARPHCRRFFLWHHADADPMIGPGPGLGPEAIPPPAVVQ